MPSRPQYFSFSQFTTLSSSLFFLGNGKGKGLAKSGTRWSNCTKDKISIVLQCFGYYSHKLFFIFSVLERFSFSSLTCTFFSNEMTEERKYLLHKRRGNIISQGKHQFRYFRKLYFGTIKEQFVLSLQSLPDFLLRKFNSLRDFTGLCCSSVYSS